MSNLKCPFCQQKLVRHWGIKEPALYCCDNPKCSRGGVATESSWQELIRTRKALEIAVDAIDVISLKYHKDTPSIFLIKYAQNAKAEITALEQKDVK